MKAWRQLKNKLWRESRDTQFLQNRCSLSISFALLQLIGCTLYVWGLLSTEGNKDKDFYIGSSKACLSHRLLSIKLPDIVGRSPRSLDDLKCWKATELKNWLLHYSVAVLCPVLNPLYLFHWTLLIGGIGILCSDSSVNDNLSSADSMLQDFILLMGILYAPTKCTMNVHLLQHLAYYFSRRGPIWAYSCFAFEGKNAFIKPLVHGMHHEVEQIGCTIGHCFGLSNLTNDVLANANVPKDSKRLIRSLTGYSRSNYRTSSRIEGGYLCEKHSNVNSNILTLVNVHVIQLLTDGRKIMKLRLIVDLRVTRVKNSIPLWLKHGKQTQLLSNILKILLFVMGESSSFWNWIVKQSAFAINWRKLLTMSDLTSVTVTQLCIPSLSVMMTEIN